MMAGKRTRRPVVRYALPLLAVSGLLVTGCCTTCSLVEADAPMLAHNVYFALNDASPAAREKLVTDCYKYLHDHPGVTYFAAGRIVEEHARDVNVRDWDVGLHIVFASKDYHDQYQQAQAHHDFIEANRDNWKSVRVFDTFIERSR
jgi:hypothetical protein